MSSNPDKPDWKLVEPIAANSGGMAHCPEETSCQYSDYVVSYAHVFRTSFGGDLVVLSKDGRSRPSQKRASGGLARPP